MKKYRYLPGNKWNVCDATTWKMFKDRLSLNVVDFTVERESVEWEQNCFVPGNKLFFIHLLPDDRKAVAGYLSKNGAGFLALNPTE